MKTEITALTAGFERDNQPLADLTGAILARIVDDRAAHARFLNTLSMMEHMGSYKIMATQKGPMIDQATLKHSAEETRHAFFFKRLAERDAGRAMTYGGDDLLAAAAARNYFQRLEASVVATLGTKADRRAAYLIMSLTVEFRAVWAYRIYQSVLTRAGQAISLKSLLAEEAGHLTDMASRLEGLGQFDIARQRHLLAIEKSLYEKLLSALDRRVAIAA
jgi:hypothetical protein